MVNEGSRRRWFIRDWLTTRDTGGCVGCKTGVLGRANVWLTKVAEGDGPFGVWLTPRATGQCVVGEIGGLGRANVWLTKVAEGDGPLAFGQRYMPPDMKNETFTWHERDSLGTLEPAPTHRKTEIFISKPISRRTSEHQIRSPELPTDIPDPVPSIEIYDESNSSRNTDESKVKKPSKELTVVRRRGKRLCKGKCRRGSAYGQQTEVCDLLESTETQISHIGNKSTRTSIPTSNGDAENLVATPNRTSAMNNTPSTMLPSFIDANILKHLYRELDNDKIDAEFSVRRKIALQEALRVKGENYSHSKRSQKLSNPVLADLPRVFSRRAVRFEILGSESLHGLTVLEYLSKNVKCRMRNSQRYRIPFEKYLVQFPRYISPDDIYKALGDVMGEPITHEQEAYLKSMIGEIKEPLFVKSWFGLCAAAERLLCRFLPKEKDPATSLQTVDFEIFERRLKFINVDPQLVQFF
ncbi:hypothetical protein WH47_01696 [Habropoda laboriosa]|uniref:Uncharacterized protein n=1 Tax=Habropoda laboriosa TaxID=597456 RepID=A0A0L7QJS2_9HYME|nr:hypothetical protein WH47_01696 [Habropoda laboriosa]